MTAAWSLLALALYLLPLAIVFVARARPERAAFEAALDLPTTIAVDMLSILLVARFTTLEVAAFVVRGVWVAAGGFFIFRRRGRVRTWWHGVRLRNWVTPLLVAAVAVGLSTVISLSCGIWDRYWHIPLAGSMRGQSTPFFNVYENGRPLFYHYAGDALTAVLQSFSFDHVHTAYAMSRAHDMLFGVFGLLIAGVLPAARFPRPLQALGGALACLLSGPVTLLIEGDARPAAGRSIIHLVSLSFRPHAALAFVLIVGFAFALLLPLWGEVAARRTRVCLFACAALLVLTDETSLALLGIFLGTVWLLAPQVLAPSRKRGVVVALGVLLTIPAVVLIFGGTFTPGGVSATLKWVPWRLPGFDLAAVPLPSVEGFELFTFDFFVILLVWLAGVLACVGAPSLAVWATFAGYTVVSVVSLTLLTKVEINGGGLECHRFATLALLMSPLFGLFFGARLAREAAPSVGRQVAWAAVALAVSAPGFSSAQWLWGLRPAVRRDGMSNYEDVDCRKMGALFGQRVRMAYVDQSMWYPFAGCRPLRAPTSQSNLVSVQIYTSWPAYGWQGVRRLDAWLGGESMLAYCPTVGGDAVCGLIVSDKHACEPETPTIQRCFVPTDLRRAWLATYDPTGT